MLTVTQTSRLPRRSALSGDLMMFGVGYPHCSVPDTRPVAGANCRLPSQICPWCSAALAVVRGMSRRFQARSGAKSGFMPPPPLGATQRRAVGVLVEWPRPGLRIRVFVAWDHQFNSQINHLVPAHCASKWASAARRSKFHRARANSPNLSGYCTHFLKSSSLTSGSFFRKATIDQISGSGTPVVPKLGMPVM
jgi:hypothetical protein